MTSASRPLTAAEKYYAFLDRLFPMNLLLVAELDRCLPIDEVAERWTQFVALRSVTRFQVHADLTLSDAQDAEPDFAALELSSDRWNEQLSHDSSQSFGLDRSMGCRYLTSPAEGRSRLYFVVHHAVVDGRVGIAALQQFVRALDGQPVPPQRHLSVELPSQKSFPWQQDRRELIALLRDMAARNKDAGPPEPTEWAAPAGPRRPRFFSLSVEGADAEGFLAGAKRHGARAYSSIAAGWLVAVARKLGEEPEPTLQLATPIDLGVPSEDPDRPSSPVVSIVADRYRVPPQSPWELAPQVTAKLQASIDRGEGELFFHLARSHNVDDLDVGAGVVAHAIGSAPPTVSVTNLGVVDPGSDPAWLRTMCGYLSPTPNQVVFVSGLGYRGRLVHSISTDDSQLAPDTAAALVSEYCNVVREMGRS